MPSPISLCFLFLTLFAAFSFAGVSVSSPTNGATVGTSVHYVATASSSCAKGVSGIGIYTGDDHLVHVDNGNKLDETINLSPGTYTTTVQEWDNCGGTSKVQIKINVTTSASALPANARTFNNLQSASGWNGYALLPPNYPLCTWCSPSGPETTWSWTKGIKLTILKRECHQNHNRWQRRFIPTHFGTTS